tara:strand:+ start:2359 stop:3120 length:762 start_codon:yes stop_codon:yes gene_type:complete
MPAPATHLLRQFRKAVLDVAFPPGCIKCGEMIDASGHLCADCWSDITYISAPFCDICGYPFEYDVGKGAVCGACIKRPPPYSRARSVFKYDEASRDMILGYKHSDQTDRAPAFAGWMIRAGISLIRECDIICPVPLHRRRLISRRFNQSALLALEIAKRTGKTAVPDLVLRQRPTRSQGGLNASARFRNVRGAFLVNPSRQQMITDKSILLIDDVLTTGATVSACAKALLKAGAADVSVLTISRVVRAGNTAI